MGVADPEPTQDALAARSALERALREREHALRHRVAELSRPPERGAELGFGKRIGDGTTEAVGRLSEIAIGSSLETSLLRVARAVEKLAQGNYGVCDLCGQPIAPARLAAAPESTLCIECARRNPTPA